MFPKTLDDIPTHERVFCNRSLNMRSIKAVGFDMDYTLAQYKLEVFEKLAYEETLKKLVGMGYPKKILDFEFDNTHMIRGLVIDKKRGNILKMDRHRYVKVAYHGFRELSSVERKKIYDVENVIIYEEPNFALIDTVFSLAEAFLYTQIVDYKGKSNKLQGKTFEEIFYEIRTCMDLSHRDGSIKLRVAKNPEEYIRPDAHLNAVFEELRGTGRKLFLLTNSLWDYTNPIMSFLLNKGCRNKETWIDYFDAIITGSGKPGFFIAKNPLYGVDVKTGLLRNIEAIPNLSQLSDKTKVFQGGHVKILHNMLNVQKGSEILYVGDHIYGDILRSKREIGWRTMLVIEELESEIHSIHALKKHYDVCDALGIDRERLEDEYERLLIAFNAKKSGREVVHSELKGLSYQDIEKQVAKIGRSVARIRKLEKKELSQYHKGFHPVWGELMKAGRQNSRFAAQVQTYACLYTSSVTNFKHYGTHKNFRAVKDYMPHDIDI